LTWLPYEIEIGSSGELYVWVLVPQVDGNSSADYIVMHYNDKVNGAVPDRQNPAKLWRDYAGVWHFDEGTSGTAYDSSAFQNHASQVAGNVGVNGDKLIGYGREFDGNERLQAPYDISMNVDNRPFTMEGWIKEEIVISLLLKAPYKLMYRGTSGDYWKMDGKSGFLSFITPPVFYIKSNNVTSRSFDGGGFILAASNWLYVTMVIDPAVGVKIYGDGSPLGTTGTYRNMENGEAFNMGSSYSNHQMDEIRYGRFAADDNRVKLNYENQKSGSSLVSPQF
jgi:hypothetical protein